MQAEPNPPNFPDFAHSMSWYNRSKNKDSRWVACKWCGKDSWIFEKNCTRSTRCKKCGDLFKGSWEQDVPGSAQKEVEHGKIQRETLRAAALEAGVSTDSPEFTAFLQKTCGTEATAQTVQGAYTAAKRKLAEAEIKNKNSVDKIVRLTKELMAAKEKAEESVIQWRAATRELNEKQAAYYAEYPTVRAPEPIQRGLPIKEEPFDLHVELGKLKKDQELLLLLQAKEEDKYHEVLLFKLAKARDDWSKSQDSAGRQNSQSSLATPLQSVAPPSQASLGTQDKHSETGLSQDAIMELPEGEAGKGKQEAGGLPAQPTPAASSATTASAKGPSKSDEQLRSEVVAALNESVDSKDRELGKQRG